MKTVKQISLERMAVRQEQDANRSLQEAAHIRRDMAEVNRLQEHARVLLDREMDLIGELYVAMKQSLGE